MNWNIPSEKKRDEVRAYFRQPYKAQKLEEVVDIIAMTVLKLRVNEDAGHVFASPEAANEPRGDDAIAQSLWEFGNREVVQLMCGGGGGVG